MFSDPAFIGIIRAGLVLGFVGLVLQVLAFASALFFGLILLTRHRPLQSRASAFRLLGSCAVALGSAVLMVVGSDQGSLFPDVLIALFLAPVAAPTVNSHLFGFHYLLILLTLAPGVMLGIELFMARRSRLKGDGCSAVVKQ